MMVDRAAKTTVILDRAIHTEGVFHIIMYIIELDHREGFIVVPGFALVMRNVHSSVVPVDQQIGIIGINPHGMMIGVQALIIEALKCSASIGGFGKTHTHHVDGVGIIGIYPDLAKYPTVGIGQVGDQTGIRAHLFPAFPFVVASEYLGPVYFTCLLPTIGIDRGLSSGIDVMVVHESIYYIGV